MPDALDVHVMSKELDATLTESDIEEIKKIGKETKDATNKGRRRRASVGSRSSN